MRSKISKPLAVLTATILLATSTAALAQRARRPSVNDFSIKTGPHLATITPAEVEQVRAKDAPAATGRLGLSQLTENTQLGLTDLMQLPNAERLILAQMADVSKAWPYAPLAVKPRVVFQANGAYTAAALLDGTIVVSMGLVEGVETDSELLYVLSHEQAHLLMGHHYKREQTDRQRALLRLAETGYQIGTVATQLTMNESGQVGLKDEAQTKANIEKASQYKGHIKYMIDSIFEPGWNRRQEDEADVLAADLLLAANKSPLDYNVVFDKLSASQKQRVTLINALQGEASQAFAQSLTSENVAQAVQSGDANMLVAGLQSQLQNNLTTAARNWALAPLKATHREPAQRRDGMVAYFSAAHPTADPPDTGDALLQAIRSSPEYAKALALSKGFEAANAKRINDPAGALADLNALGANKPGAPSFLYARAAEIEAAGLDYPSAKRYYALALAAPLPAASTFQGAADVAMEMRELPQAQAIIDRAVRMTADEPFFYASKIKLALRKGDKAEAERVKGLCRSVPPERTGITEACLRELPDATPAATPAQTATQAPATINELSNAIGGLFKKK